MIPDEAVEALARVLAQEALFAADAGGYGWDAETDSSDHFMPGARKKAIRYLDAAAPLLIEHLAKQIDDQIFTVENTLVDEHDYPALCAQREALIGVAQTLRGLAL